MRLLLMGTGPFGLPSFEALQQSEHEVVHVMTRPARRSVRGKIAAHPVAQWAERHRLPTSSPATVNNAEVCAAMTKLQADLLVVCDFGEILKPQTLAVTRFGGINLHGSLLPKYRGAAPVNWALWHGEVETGVSVIHMSPKLDAGPILAQQALPIDPDDDAVVLEEKLARLGVCPVRESLELIMAWDGESPLGQRQDPGLACPARRLRKTDGRVDWSRTATQIRDQVRALKPWPGTFTHVPGRKSPLRVILERVSVVGCSADQHLADGDSAPPAASQAVQPGRIARCDSQHLWVGTGRHLLAIERIQPAGKRSMEIADFLRGRQIAPGTALD